MSADHKNTILVVDDAAMTREILQRNLTSEGYTVFTVPSVSEAIKILDAQSIDLVITDFKMPQVSGLDLIRHVRENYKDTEVMMITGYATIEGAVEAMKSGAEEYLSKPFTDQELFDAVEKILARQRMRRSGNQSAEKRAPERYGLLGASAVMRSVFESIDKVVDSKATVLITGESGTGKELVARAIHYNGARASAPFIPINCGGIPEKLLESELFGYVKGAFTGATESRAGFFQTADGGTIFLDEISETGISMQVKLLRVLQDREVCMVGANRPRNVDVRIIAATNKDLFSLVQKGSFREDLFFRLNVITIDLPPLRDRGDDIILLANHFAEKFAAEQDKKKLEFSPKALEVLKNYNWPGNVRELENVVQRLSIMAENSIIDVPDMPSIMRFSALRETGLTRTLAEVEAEYIKNVLATVNGNKTKAAKILGIDRKTLREKLKQHGSQ